MDAAGGLHDIGDAVDGRGNKTVGIMWNTMYDEGGDPVSKTPLSIVESALLRLVESFRG